MPTERVVSATQPPLPHPAGWKWAYGIDPYVPYPSKRVRSGWRAFDYWGMIRAFVPDGTPLEPAQESDESVSGAVRGTEGLE